MNEVKEFNILSDLDYYEDYADFVFDLLNHKHQNVDDRLTHIILGIVTESGEIADILRKTIGYLQDFDHVNAKEEIGDLMFYIVALCKLQGYSLGDIIDNNREKLEKRYPNGWTPQAAKDRADKNPPQGQSADSELFLHLANLTRGYNI